MSKKINGFSPLGFSPYNARSSNVDRSALQSARVEQGAATEPARGAQDENASTSRHTEDLSTAERRMILRAFPEDPDLSLRLYGPNRDAQTVNPSAVGGQIDVHG